MLGKTHLLFAFFLSTFFTQPLAWLIIIGSSLLPDIDSGTSLLGRKFKLVGVVFEHRGFFHSFFFYIPASVIAYSLSPLVGWSFALGCGSHLLLDMMTKQGLQLYPFKKKIKGFIKVGSLAEKVFFVFILFGFLLRLSVL